MNLLVLVLFLFSLCGMMISPAFPAEPVPIPGLALWEKNMQDYGRRHGNPTTIKELQVWEGGAWYYDGARVFFQIADYTGSDGWNSSATEILKISQDYILNNDGHIPGWRVFPHGLYMDYKRNGNVQSKNAAILLAKNSAYAGAGGGADESLSRETAFIINAYIIAELLGEPRNPNLEKSIDYALGHINQWFVQNSSSNWAPFMFGLTAEALITYYEQIKADPRIPAAIQLGVDEVWKRAWVEKDQSFFYRADDATDGAPDLNLLVAPAFAWVYHQTGDISYRDNGDKAFAGGMRAYLWGGKQFSQNYRSSFNYVQWRLLPPLSNISVSISGRDIIFNWLTAEPSETQITYGETSSLTIPNAYKRVLESSVLVTNHALTLKNLKPGVPYYYNARSTNINGSVTYLQKGTFIPTIQDIVAPVISDVNAITYSTYVLIFEWRTNEPANSQIEFGLDTNYGTISPLYTFPFTTWHIIQYWFPDQQHWLEYYQVYHYRILSRDIAGNLTMSKDMTFTPTPPSP